MNKRGTVWMGLFALACSSAWAGDAAVTDPQIAAIVVTANQVDIDAGKLAGTKAASGEVKTFGQRMVADHTGVNKSATELVTRLGVKPEPNATSKNLQKGGDENLAALKNLSGAAFDKAYQETVRSRHFRARSLLRESLAREVDLA